MRFWGAVLTCVLWPAPGILGAETSLETSPWDVSLTVRGGAGYKDNILLAHTQTQSSVFTLTGIEAFLFRAPIDNWEFTSVISGEDRRYWQSADADKEQLFFGTAEVKRRFWERWKVGLAAQYFYNDQIFDASITEDIRLRIRAQSHRWSGGPLLAVELPQKRRIELSANIVRLEFEELLDNSWEGGPKLLFGQKYGNSSEITLTAAFRERSYEHRHAPGPAGTIIGKSLQYQQEDFEIGVKHNWDKERTWKSRVRLGLEINEDNGFGHFDYRKYRISKDLSFTKGSFEGIFAAKFLHYEFLTQRTLFGDQARRLSELDFSLRLKQGITRSMSLFIESEYEWVLATDSVERYRSASVWAGLEWSFE
jgi:hypothetical protein